jgi:hypothetical protein
MLKLPKPTKIVVLIVLLMSILAREIKLFGVKKKRLSFKDNRKYYNHYKKMKVNIIIYNRYREDHYIIILLSFLTMKYPTESF